MARNWYVVATEYHGGGIVSRHKTRELAERAARRWRLADCVCGCCAVVRANQYAALPRYNGIDSLGSPYAIVGR